MEKLIIATDFSSPASNAIQYGVHLSNNLGTELILVHAFKIPLGGYNSLGTLDVISDMQRFNLKALEKIKEDLIQQLGYDPGIECLAEAGSVDNVIQEIIQQHSVDLVIMGMTGEGGLIKKHLIGSNALTASRNLEVPVLIVPQHTVYKPINRMCFAIDMTKLEESSVIYSARYFASLFNAEIELVTVKKKGEDTESEKVASDSFIERHLQHLHHKIVYLQNDDVAETLEYYFKFHETDMILVNPEHNHFFERLFHKSITKHLLFELNIPLLVIH